MFEIFLHWIAGIIGIALMYCGALLYENEENAIHNKLDDWWKALDAKGKVAVNGHLSIMQKFAFAAFGIITKIFGVKAWSWQNFFATCCICGISAHLSSLAIELPFYEASDWRIFIFQNSQDFYFVLVFSCLLFCPLVKSFANKKRFWVIAVFLIYVVSYNTFNKFPAGRGFFQIGIYLANCALWVAFDAALMGYSYFSKCVLNLFLHKPASKGNIVASVVWLIFIIGGVLAIKSSYHMETYSEQHHQISIASGNLIVGAFIIMGLLGVVWLAFASLLLSLIALVMLHSALWGMMQRPVYSIAHHKLMKEKKLLLGVGLVLSGYACRVPEFVKEVFKAG